MGWAERLTRRSKAAARVFDRRACQELATRIRAGLAGLDISFNPAQPIGRIVADLDWVAGFPAEPFEPGGAREDDPDRFSLAFLRSLQAVDLAELLDVASHIRDSPRLLRQWIRKQIDRMAGTDTVAQDVLFEMEIAAHLAQWHDAGLDVSFEEPDIVVRMPSEPGVGATALACKRPRSFHSLRPSLHDAVAQIKRRQILGIVMVGCDALLAASDGAPWTIATDSEIEAQIIGERRIQETLDRAASDIEAERDRLVLGVHLSARPIHRRPGALGYFWVARQSPNPHIDRVAKRFAAKNLAALELALFTKPQRPPP